MDTRVNPDATDAEEAVSEPARARLLSEADIAKVCSAADIAASAVELRLPGDVSLWLENPYHEAQFVRCHPEGDESQCRHIDVRPCRQKEVPSNTRPQRVFLPQTLIQRGIRLVLNPAAVASGIAVIA